MTEIQLGLTVELGRDRPLQLDSGAELAPFTVAYRTWGRLNADRSNVVLICHALTGDQYVIGGNPVIGYYEPTAGAAPSASGEPVSAASPQPNT